MFWTIVHIFSDRELLQQIREELEVTSVRSSSDGLTKTLELATMREKCHLLHATFKEVLRHHALGSSVRYVREDINLDDTFLLRKGMVVQMPMSVLHHDRSSWGDDTSAFRPDRFLKDGNGSGRDMKQNPAAFRPFGGGTSLCPGRQLATLETMALAAYMVLRFDMEPVKGAWVIPRAKQESLATNVFPPENDMRVRIKARNPALTYLHC